MIKMAKVLGLSKLLLLVAVVGCGSAEDGHVVQMPPPDGGPRPDIGCAVLGDAELNAGDCSFAHEPRTMQCPSMFKQVMRCNSPETRPMPECVSSLDCNASIWCCPGADTFED